MQYKQLKEYFAALATSHVELNGNFVCGNTSKLRADTVSKFKGPILWLEVPSIEINSSTSAYFGKKVSAVTICQPYNDKTTTEAQMDNMLDELEAIVFDLMAKLLKDAKENGSKIDLSESDIYPIDPLLVDNLIGWRFEFKLTGTINICYNEARWN